MSKFAQLRAVRGSIAPLLALLVVASGGLALGVARVGVSASLRARAQTAADAAALAGALDGEGAARRLAAANGADLVAFALEGAEVEVEVAVGEARAWARARPVAGWPTDTDRGHRGMTVDVPRTTPPTPDPVNHPAFPCQPPPATDPVHFGLCRTREDR